MLLLFSLLLVTVHLFEKTAELDHNTHPTKVEGELSQGRKVGPIPPHPLAATSLAMTLFLAK